MHRFYLPKTVFSDSTIQLTDPTEIHHLKNVLRLKEKSKIAIFNGVGTEAEGEIVSLSSSTVTIKIGTLNKVKPRETIISLACAIPKKAKFETIIEKCTELGIDEIIPLMTKRTEIRLDEEKRIKKLQRYQTVAINAAKQSKRSTVPDILPVTNYNVMLNSLSENSVAIIPHLEGERRPLLDILTTLEDPKRIVFFIGPEGDFTPAEVKTALEKNCIPASLGETVLKVDTAAIHVVSASRLLINKK